MSDIYDRFQRTASRLMGKYQQGVVALVRDGAMSGPEWAPAPGPGERYTMDATVSGAAQEYVDGTTVRATDLQVRSAVFGAEPQLSDRVEIDGREHQVVRVDQIPAAGTVVAWLIFVRS